MADPSSLYGVKPTSKMKAREISSSANLAFTSQLSSLISQKTSEKPRHSNPAKRTSDIFATHNKGSQKRAAADIKDDGDRAGKTTAEIGDVDSSTLHRSKRRMEEKARLYAAMKWGDYITPENGQDERCLVDFDRKWAEQDAIGDGQETSSGSDADSEEELVDYVDEFGRQRKGTRADVARENRRRRIQSIAVEDEARFAARPKMPGNILYGDTIQHGAFNPDAGITRKMENLAQKRDRSATPPEEAHYDASAEVRTKGTGFYSFSKDKAGRATELDALGKERIETERAKAEREAKKQARMRELEERKKQLQEQKGRKKADRFLNSLDIGLG